MAQRAVSRVNLDLMFALPGQTLAACTDDLRQALAFGTEHLSLYHLTMEPNTVFAKFPPEDLPDDDASAAMQDLVETELATAGLARYEVSAYARSGARCRHNLNYWEFGDYLGIGPGAHGKLSFHDRIVREARLRNPESWMQAAAARRQPSGRKPTGRAGRAALRVHAERLAPEGRRGGDPVQRAHRPVAGRHRAPVEAAAKRGLLDADPTRLQATSLGWRFLNDLQEMFL